MNPTDRLVQLALGAFNATVAYHTVLETSKYNAWKSSPIKGRKPYVPMADNEALTTTFRDLLETAVITIRECSKEDRS